MNIPILVEPVENNGFRATSGPPLALVTEGATCEEAVANLREQLQSRIKNGTRLMSLEFPAVEEENPWIEFAGMFKDDPYFEEVVEIMAENRTKMDADPNIP